MKKTLEARTLNVPGIIGIGKAAEIAKNKMAKEKIKVEKIKIELERELLKTPGSTVNGPVNLLIHTTTNIRFYRIEAYE